MTNLLSLLDIEKIIDFTFEAGDIILDNYYNDYKIHKKEDNSHYTSIDKLVNDFIVENLRKITQKYHIIAEESFLDDNTKLQDQEIFWLVDPIDGTDGYIKKNDEFAINIALIDRQKPVFGVIFVPCTKTLYYNYGENVFRVHNNNKSQLYHTTKSGVASKILLSKSDKISCDIAENNIYNIASEKIYSSIKFCCMAESNGDIYLRNKPTMEWDTASGHALLNALGGCIIDVQGNELKYKKKDFLNPSFIALSSKSLLEHPFIQNLLD